MLTAAFTKRPGADGVLVIRVGLEFTSHQLRVLGDGAAAARERHRAETLTADAALELRRLALVGDGLAELAAHGAVATAWLTVADLALLHDELAAWVDELLQRNWMRESERAVLRDVDVLLPDLADARTRALHAALSDPPG